LDRSRLSRNGENEIDPFTLVALASGAFKLIKDSCEMYKEGRQIVQDIKKEVDAVVKDVKSIEQDAKGVFGFFKKLFATPVVEEKKTEIVPQQTKKVKAKKQPPPEFDENLIYQQVSDALIKFFQAYNGLKHYKEEKEAEALTVGGDKGNEIAIQLVIADLQMEKLNSELSDYMVYHVPKELKDLYTRVNEKIGHIANVQALARREEMLKERKAKWQRQERKDLVQNRVVVSAITVILLGWMWLMILSLTHQPSY
jgi:hypothetical protein